MKKSLVFAMIVVLSACAKERTTKYYSTQGQSKSGEPVSYVLTNADYQKQEEEKKKQKLNKRKDAMIKPSANAENIITLQEDADQEDLAVLFDSYNVTEVQEGTPKGMATDLIPQLRISKTLGRLYCLRQTPIIRDEEEIRKATRYTCTVNMARSKDDKTMWTEDKELYDNLNIDEVELKNQKENVRAFSKTAGRFVCEKAIQLPDGDVAYHCGVKNVVLEVPSTPLSN